MTTFLGGSPQSTLAPSVPTVIMSPACIWYPPGQGLMYWFNAGMCAIPSQR